MSSLTERAKLPPLHYHCFKLQTMNLSVFAALNDGFRLYRNSSLVLKNSFRLYCLQCIFDCLSVSVTAEPVYSDDKLGS